MGNGASTAGGLEPVVVTAADEELQGKITKLKSELARRDDAIQKLHVRLAHQDQNEKKLITLKSEIDKLRSVLNQSQAHPINKYIAGESAPATDEASVPSQELPVTMEATSGEFPDMVVTTVSQSKLAVPQAAIRHKIAISAETYDESAPSKEIVRHEKSDDVRKILFESIVKNTVLSHLDSSQIEEIVECTEKIDFAAGDYIMQEGQAGDQFYIPISGKVEILKKLADGEPYSIGLLEPGHLFGELAILYNCRRTASVKAIEPTVTFALNRDTFHAIMKSTGTAKRKEIIQFLRNIASLRPLPTLAMQSLADALDDCHFEPGEHILREGEVGDNFYIIRSGQVEVSQKVENEETGKSEVVVIRTLSKGDCFGEKALIDEDVRSATIIAVTKVECVTLERSDFRNILGPLSEIKELYPDRPKTSMQLAGSLASSTIDFATAGPAPTKFPILDCKLEDLEQMGVLGAGGFGRVVLVREKQSNKTYALKCLEKAVIVASKQTQHVYAEKEVMMQLDHPLLAKLYCTFRDTRYVYMMMDVALGGELWTLLRQSGKFNEKMCRFYVGCVVLAFEYMHNKNIIYRDLKPENLLLTSNGYIKVVDFGFSKTVPAGKKTWTFCGTPEYVAPEIILNKGHNKACDYWSLGILMYELLVGRPPFMSVDHMQTYNQIVSGIDRVVFPKIISKTATNIIKRLCRESPGERIGNLKDGIKEIKKHKWFQGFDWEGLSHQTIEAPHLPNIESDTDRKNFDDVPEEDVSAAKEETSGWDDRF